MYQLFILLILKITLAYTSMNAKYANVLQNEHVQFFLPDCFSSWSAVWGESLAV